MKQITRDIIETEAEFLDRKTGPYYGEVERLKRKAARAINGQKGLARLNALVYVVRKEGFSTGNNTFFLDILDKKRGECYGLTSLYIVLGSELNLPIRYAEAPGHVFARWVEGGDTVNFEATKHALVEDEYYTSPGNFGHSGFHPRSVEAGVYMTTREPIQFLSTTLSQIAFVNLIRARYEKTIEDCEKALKINPVKASALNNRGLANIGLKQYDQAREVFEHIVELDPNDAIVYGSLGAAQLSLKDAQNALESFSRSIELDPTRPFPYFGRFCANYKTGHYGRAGADAARCLGKGVVTLLAKVGERALR